MFEKKIRMNNVVLSLGSNMGDRLSNFSTARKKIGEIPAVFLKTSAVYQTAPWGTTGQPDFLNQVVEIETSLDAHTLMEKLLTIEKTMGRERKEKWEARIIDIDILFFNDAQISSDVLTVPHRHLHERRFVLEPLNEILPQKVHPVYRKTIAYLHASLQDSDQIKKLNAVVSE